MIDELLQTGASAHDSDPYLRSVTDMAERCAVVTQDAIYSASGIKLVDKGARIDSRMYDRLVQHKLREPMDTHLTVDNAVTLQVVQQAAADMCASDSLAALLSQALGSPDALVAPLQQAVLPARLGFKLTVMREQMPDLFAHSLRMMLVALYLGLRSRMDARACADLAAAGLLHDLGALHMDPAWRDPRHRPTGAARKHLIAHPVTAMLMVRDVQAYDSTVEEAILEHHERMDGTGYPRSLQGRDISPMGQILLLAEVVAAFYEKYPDQPAQQLSLMLRLNHRKFPAPLVAHVLPLLYEESGAGPHRAMPTHGQLQSLGAQLTQAFDQWEQVKQDMGPDQPPPQGPLAFVNERLGMLKRALAEAGAHPQQHEVLLQQLQGDDEGLSELAYVVREALWQLESIANGCQRRWPHLLEQRDSPEAAAAARWCDWVRSLGTP